MKPTLALPLFLCLAAPVSQAQLFSFSAFLDGISEAPPNASIAVGVANVAYDQGAHTLQIDVTFSGLTGTVMAAHIHAPTTVGFTGTAGVAVIPGTLTGFPTLVTSGTYSQLFDLTAPSTYTSTFLTSGGGTTTGAENLLFASMNEGKAYLNIHTTTFGGGEIRGFLAPVPEPVSTSLATAGLLGAAALARRHRRATAPLRGS